MNPEREHRFEMLTSEELTPYLDGRTLAILCIGTIEEHGAHLPVGTDWLIGQRFTDDLAAHLKRHSAVSFLTLPAIWTGYSAREMQRWTGTLTLNTRTVMDLMRQTLASLCRLGFKKILVINAHGHHNELLRVVAREIADDDDVFPAVVNLFALGVKEYNQARQGAAGGSIHGGEDETSVMLHYGYPVARDKYTAQDHVDYHTEFIAGDNFIGSSKVFWSTWGYFKSQTGLLGDPTPAAAATGKVLIDACLQNLTRFIEEYMRR